MPWFDRARQGPVRFDSAPATLYGARVKRQLAIIGGGPAGLAAAEAAARDGRIAVTVYEAMPSVGRKFLMAGKGGLNISHSEPMARFMTRYGARETVLAPFMRDFGPEALVASNDAFAALRAAFNQEFGP